MTALPSLRRPAPAPLRLELVERCCADLGRAAPALEAVPEGALPPAARRLLAQTGGMTATLTRHWGEPMALEVVASAVEPGTVRRQVVLRTERTRIAAEVGFIAVDLAPLPPALREEVVAGTLPFGALLALHGVAFRSTPDLFFAVAADAPLAALLGVPEGARLYGRHTVLTDSAGERLAEAVEVLTAREPG